MRHDLEATVREIITAKVPDLLANLFRLADGLPLQKTDKDGGIDIYVTLPDRASNEYLLNRVLGKPTERHEHDYSKLSDEELIARIKTAL